jgi:GrpB-like predicted nucleotidyltransferase (UPF0157 family)
MGVPTGSRQVVEVVDYDPAWPALFGETGRALRSALGAVALRIDHIGSTAVAGLAAKPVIDAKNPYVWSVIRRADEWAQLQGWVPGPSDA